MSILLVYLGYHLDMPLGYMVLAWFCLFWQAFKVFVAFVKGVYNAGKDGK